MNTSTLDGRRRVLGATMAVVVLLLVTSGSVVRAEEVDAATVKEIREAAEQGDMEAQYNLGFMYRNGKGVAQNSAEAVKW